MSFLEWIRQRRALRHGTRRRYLRGCRCRRCTRANYEYFQRWKAEHASKPIPKHVHGTRNGYKNYGCRCRRCMTTMRDVWREERRRRAG